MQWDSAYGSARQPPELMHYGIRGQKWGIRRFQNEDRSLTAAGKERYGRGSKSSGRTGGISKKAKTGKKNKDPNARENWKAKDAKDLSDEELRRRNTRLQAEQNYKNSTTPQWKKDAKQWGKEALKAILITSLTAVFAESLKETIKPAVKKKAKTLFNKASKKTISSLRSAKRKAAPFAASLIMKSENMKQGFKKR